MLVTDDGLVATADAATAAIDQLSAVRVVLSTERLATEYDILISTSIEALREGPKTTEQLASRIAQVWPDAATTIVQLRAALGAAEAADYVARTTHGWALSMQGLAEAAEAREWAESAFDRTLAELRARAQKALRAVDREEGELWLGILVTSLFDGIKWAYAAFKGEVSVLPGAGVVPRRVDRDRLFQSIRALANRDEVAEFLEASALDAIDPSTPFGNEIVSYITTGYVLHAFMARRDQPAVREQAAAFSATTFILDTPLLFSLLGDSETSAPFREAISSAVAVGSKIVVGEHTLSELQSVLARVESRYLVTINAALASPSSSKLLRQLVDEPLIEQFIAGIADERWTDWPGFRRHVGQLRRILVGLGVEVTPHGNTATDHVAECFSALGKSLARSSHGRGASEIQRDANTMAYAWRVRRAQTTKGVWPAAWIVTPDTHMDRAYKMLNRKDAAGISLAASQWVAALSVLVPPASLDRLAVSGAAFVTQEVFVRVAARFPPDVALSIATALAPEAGGTDTDVRVGQLTLDQMLTQYPDLYDDPEAAGAKISASIIAHRSSRVAKAHSYQQERLATERARMLTAQDATQAALDDERSRRQTAEDALAGMQDQYAAKVADSERTRLLDRRRFVANAIVLVALVGMVILAAATTWSLVIGAPAWGFGVALAATMLTTLLFWSRSRSWVIDPATTWMTLLAAFIPEVVAIVVLALPYLLPPPAPLPPMP
jgi:hypothetical protein